LPRQQVQLDREKLKEAIWLIASHCPPEELGNVKLHKILYFSDMLFFLHEGRPITGVDYLKQKFGPVARHLTVAVAELVSEGRLEVTEREYFGLYKKSYIPREPYNAGRISAEEAELIREVADFVRGKSAREISEISHNAAWEAATLGEVIPYYTALRLVPTEVTDSDRQWATESARAYATESPF
jgi:uncharacterized phage-associated protein